MRHALRTQSAVRTAFERAAQQRPGVQLVSRRPVLHPGYLGRRGRSRRPTPLRPFVKSSRNDAALRAAAGAPTLHARACAGRRHPDRRRSPAGTLKTAPPRGPPCPAPAHPPGDRDLLRVTVFPRAQNAVRTGLAGSRPSEVGFARAPCGL